MMRKLRLKNSSDVLIPRLFAVLTFAIGFVFVSISPKEQSSNVVTENIVAHVIEVKVPPILDKKLSTEERFWRYEKFLNPNLKIPSPIPKGIPNSCGFLHISIEIDGLIILNSEISGNLENTDVLKSRLEDIFRQRTLNGVYVEGSDKIAKSVVIKASASTKYGDFIKVLTAIKESGAEPIVLRNDVLGPSVHVNTFQINPF